MLTLDDVTLFAHGLDRVEDADPNAGAHESEAAVTGRGVYLEHIIAADQADQSGNDGGTDEGFPTVLIDENAPMFAHINLNLH